MTYDTGMLIALERRKPRAMAIHQWLLEEESLRVLVPWAVVVEFWRGRSDRREKVLESVEVELPTLSLAKIAGEALAAVRGSTLVDAIVMSSAASRGDVVYTSDIDDLTRLQTYFPSVRVLGI